MLVTVLCAEAAATSSSRAPSAAAPLRDLAAAHAARYGGGAVRVEADRVLVVFDGRRAIRCACAVAADARAMKLDVRAGLHTGECEMVGGVPRGVVVDIGSRVAALAKSGEVLVTRTVVDLVAGSGMTFKDRGMYSLARTHKGWRVYAARVE